MSSAALVGVVHIDAIREGDNCRIFYGDVAELARTIEASGYVAPLVVRHVGGDQPFELVAGNRRLRAHKLLALEHAAKSAPRACRCDADGARCRWQFVPIESRQLDSVQALKLNAAENLARKDLHFVELVGVFVRFRKLGYSATATAAELGMSSSHVQNCLRVRDRACPELLERIEAGQEFPIQQLFFWATLPPERQREELDRWLTRKNGASDSEAGAARRRGPSRTRLETILSLVRKAAMLSHAPTETARLEGMIEGLEIALGRRQHPKLP